VIDYCEVVGIYMLVQKRSFGSKKEIKPYSESDLSVHKTLNIIKFSYKIYFPVALRPIAGYDLLFVEDSRSHTSTNHSRWDYYGRVTSWSQRLPDNTEHSQETNIHAPGGIRTYIKRADAHPQLRPRGHLDRNMEHGVMIFVELLVLELRLLKC
jgi:hypothetical protein